MSSRTALESSRCTTEDREMRLKRKTQEKNPEGLERERESWMMVESLSELKAKATGEHKSITNELHTNTHTDIS